jgi:hypothetical protein
MMGRSENVLDTNTSMDPSYGLAVAIKTTRESRSQRG